MMSLYKTLTGRSIDSHNLPQSEQRLLSGLLEEAGKKPDWVKFSRFWSGHLAGLLKKLPREGRTQHALYRIAQDLEMRLGIAQGAVAEPDYRDYLVAAIEEQFGSRYRFCKATGIPEGELSQVLSGKKNFSVERLTKAAKALQMSVTLLPTASFGPGASSEKRALEEVVAVLKGDLTLIETFLDHLKKIDSERRWECFLKEKTMVDWPLKQIEDEVAALPVEQRPSVLLDKLEQLEHKMTVSFEFMRDRLAVLHDQCVQHHRSVV